MIGELMRHQADLAISDLTATWLRETAVDFTMPFMNLGIAILFKKTAIPDPKLFSFLKPLSVEVWLYLGSAFLAISIILWLMARISPYEWVSPHSCDPEPLELENQFSIGNSLWFTIVSTGDKSLVNFRCCCLLVKTVHKGRYFCYLGCTKFVPSEKWTNILSP